MKPTDIKPLNYPVEILCWPDPFCYPDGEEIGQLKRDKDAVFVALCEIARQWVYELAEEHL